MAQDFDEIRFPDTISKGSAGGPERMTDVVVMGSGYEERNATWADSRRRYDASLGLRGVDDLHDVLEFFEARNGRLIGFRWKDWIDHRSGKPRSQPKASDQTIGIGDGTETSFQLSKTYSSGPRSYTRLISKPVDGTVLVEVNGVELSSGAFTVNTETGIVALAVAPATGQIVKAGYEFDVPVRFDADYIACSMDAFKAGSVPQIDVIEVKV